MSLLSIQGKRQLNEFWTHLRMTNRLTDDVPRLNARKAVHEGRHRVPERRKVRPILGGALTWTSVFGFALLGWGFG